MGFYEPLPGGFPETVEGTEQRPENSILSERNES
jgi:hypothetical protein